MGKRLLIGPSDKHYMIVENPGSGTGEVVQWVKAPGLMTSGVQSLGPT